MRGRPDYGEVKICAVWACGEELGVNGVDGEFLRGVCVGDAVGVLENGGLGGREREASEEEGKKQEEVKESPPW